jgi:hypothetical protein
MSSGRRDFLFVRELIAAPLPQLTVLLGVCWTFLEIFLRQFDCCWDWLGI